ncbi:MAG: glycosyl transferase family 1 [Hyphomonas sp.]|uniref:glycosyltransferase n=1 Tax=Hyphomonas sp. TaxID=87 RepID=UPI001D7CBC26|nr:glycosyltransferase [Hyphomonas sp.]MBA4227613.1 glycosyl transferase family 1 [Hyphomonas sp.]
MKIVFASNNGYLPQFSGGVQSNTDYLARSLKEAGHSPAVLAELFAEGFFGFRSRIKLKLSRTRFTQDNIYGYPVYRAWVPCDAIADLVRHDRPDVVVAQCHGSVRIAEEFHKHGVPVVLYFHNVEFDELEGDPSSLKGCHFISNSDFTRDRYRQAFGIESVVIPPIIDRREYEVTSTGDFVTFINPVAKKGLATVVEIARSLPEIPFLLVESWTLTSQQLADLSADLASLPNVTFRRRTDNMRDIYSQTRILLAPSLWEEAWGRVVSEAHCSGIPVVGSNRGGLPEAIGPGGMILAHDAPIADWTKAVSDLWTNGSLYRQASDAARQYADRPELNAEQQRSLLLSVIAQAAAGTD